MDNPKPVIARVQGHVAGGGNGLVAAADLSVAVESAKFAFSEVRLGLGPGGHQRGLPGPDAPCGRPGAPADR